MSIVTIYSLFATPVNLVFWCHYSCYNCRNLETNIIETDVTCKEETTKWQKIDMAFEGIWILNMILNFFKKTRTHNTLHQIV